MKLLRVALLYVIIIMLVSCGKEKENSVVPGYIKPGEFRPKGMIVKGYNLPFSISGGGESGTWTCSGEQCLSVHGLWNTENIPVEGVAIKDNDTVNSQLLMKMTRVKGIPWKIKVTYKGTEYENSVVDNSFVDLSFCTTSIPTSPAYDPDGVPGSGDELKASEIFLVKATVKFLQDVQLQTSDKSKTLTLSTGGQIVAHAHSEVGSTSCP